MDENHSEIRLPVKLENIKLEPNIQEYDQENEPIEYIKEHIKVENEDISYENASSADNGIDELKIKSEYHKQPTNTENYTVIKHYDVVHLCQHCDKIFETFPLLKNHLIVCEKKTVENNQFSNVIINMPIKPRLNDVKDKINDKTRYSRCHEPTVCLFCKTTFKNKIQLHNHTCYAKKDNIYSCSVCNRGYSRKSSLTNHIKIHKYVPGRQVLGDSAEMSDESDKLEYAKCESDMYPYYSCDLFGSNYVFMKTEENEEENDDDVEDTNINTIIIKQENADDENQSSFTTMSDENSIENVNFECQYCKTEYATILSLTNHLVTCDKKHPDKKTSVKDLKRKMGKSSDAVLCCICNKKFKDNIQLHNHKCGKMSVNNMYSCNICQRQFSRKTCLVNHQKIHRYIPGRALIKQEFVT